MHTCPGWAGAALSPKDKFRGGFLGRRNTVSPNSVQKSRAQVPATPESLIGWFTEAKGKLGDVSRDTWAGSRGWHSEVSISFPEQWEGMEAGAQHGQIYALGQHRPMWSPLATHNYLNSLKLHQI